MSIMKRILSERGAERREYRAGALTVSGAGSRERTGCPGSPTTH